MRIFLSAILAVFTASQAAFACSVCFGSSDILVSKSLNAGIIALIGFVGMVLFSIAYTAFVWSQRAKRLSIQE